MDPVNMNTYASFHLRGLREHWLKDIPDKRPVLLARSGGTDSGALGVILWSGDISARWDVLAAQVTEAVRVSCSGIPWWTLDIGAFFVDRKDPWFWRGDYPAGVQDPAYRELYIRWFQFGAMLPVFRSHGTDTPREPWAFGDEDSPEYACLRDIIRLRYRLLPWLYSEAARSCETGLPMIRAMLTAFGGNSLVRDLSDQYMLGDALLVKPVTRSLKDGGGTTEAALPEGGWYNLFTKAYEPGGTRVTVKTPLDRFPVFIRAGSILPVSGDACCAADLKTPADELLVFSGADGAFTLYDDEGDGMDYLRGAYLKIPFRWGEATGTLLAGKAEGSLPVRTRLQVRLIRPDGLTQTRTLDYDGEPVRLNF
jgi:alpha-D-xyloside xylohydrolase